MHTDYHTEKRDFQPGSYRTSKNVLHLLGRILIGVPFIIVGIGDIFDWDHLLAYSRSQFIEPWAMIAVLFFTLSQFLGGLSVLLGYQIRWGAILLVAFLIFASVFFHRFWNLDEVELVPTSQAFHSALSFYFKNISIIGGLFYIISHGPGMWSIDASLQKKRND